MLSQEKMKTLVLKLQSEGYTPEETMRLQNLAIGAHKAADASRLVLTDDLLDAQAQLAKRHLDALLRAGFTQDQAILICAHAPYRVMPAPPQMTGMQAG